MPGSRGASQKQLMQQMQTTEAPTRLVDAGDDGGAGLRLVKNQAPVYADQVADAMTLYLSEGASSKRAQAQLDSVLANEIASFKPVHESMGIFSFLPFEVPFLEAVDPQDMNAAKKDHDLQICISLSLID
jgi:hypothetical protein